MKAEIRRAADAEEVESSERCRVDGELVGPVGSSRFRYGNEEVDVQYFLVRARTKGRDTEGRRRLWLPPPDARAQLSFREARQLLDKALRAWRDVERTPPSSSSSRS